MARPEGHKWLALQTQPSAHGAGQEHCSQPASAPAAGRSWRAPLPCRHAPAPACGPGKGGSTRLLCRVRQALLSTASKDIVSAGAHPPAGRCGTQQDDRWDRPQGRLHQHTECTRSALTCEAAARHAICLQEEGARISSACSTANPAIVSDPEIVSGLHTHSEHCTGAITPLAAPCRLGSFLHTPKTFLAAFWVMRRWLQPCAAEPAGETLHHQLGPCPTASTFVSNISGAGQKGQQAEVGLGTCLPWHRLLLPYCLSVQQLPWQQLHQPHLQLSPGGACDQAVGGCIALLIRHRVLHLQGSAQFHHAMDI